jgi:hypothetical protein
LAWRFEKEKKSLLKLGFVIIENYQNIFLCQKKSYSSPKTEKIISKKKKQISHRETDARNTELTKLYYLTVLGT